MVDEKKRNSPEEEMEETGEAKKQKATSKKGETKQGAANKKEKAQKAKPKMTEDHKATTKKNGEQKATAKEERVGEPGKATPEEIEAGKGLAAISYISILFLIPMISMRDNRFAMYHAKQSMVLVISAMVSWLVLFLIGMITSWLGIGIILIGLSYIILFAWLVFMIIGFIKAFGGEYWRIPLIADWADKVKI